MVFFVGSSLMKLLDDPIQLHRKITEFINAGKQKVKENKRNKKKGKVLTFNKLFGNIQM